MKEWKNVHCRHLSFHCRELIPFSVVFPLLLQDVNRRMKDWGAEGKINPFNEVYDVHAIFFIQMYA